MAAAPLGILGGTFDPIHFGHLRLAQELAHTMKLGGVRLVPSGTPPHRASPLAPTADRLAMVRLAVAGNPLFAVDGPETARSCPAFTSEPLSELRVELCAGAELVLMLGAAAFLEFATGHRWPELFGLAHIAVAHR